ISLEGRGHHLGGSPLPGRGTGRGILSSTALGGGLLGSARFAAPRSAPGNEPLAARGAGKSTQFLWPFATAGSRRGATALLRNARLRSCLTQTASCASRDHAYRRAPSGGGDRAGQ